MIEAPHAASCHCEIEEHEAVDDSQLTRVQEWKEAPRRVRYEVCEGHVACQNERDRTSEQPEHDEHPADELNHAVDARERHGGHSRRGRNWQAKIFRHPMLQEQQADHDAQDTQHTWGPRCEKAVDRRHHNFSSQAGLCSVCFAKLYVAAIKPPVGELTYLVELSGGLPTTTSRQGENTTTSGYQARQSCAYDRT